MYINSLETGTSDVSYFTSEYIQLVEDHLTFFSNNNRNTFLDFTEQQGYKFEGDFYGLLIDLNVPKKYHYLVLRMNGLDSSSDFSGNVFIVKIPPLNEVDSIKQSSQVLIA